MKLNVEISKTDYEEAVVNFRQTLYSALSDVENAVIRLSKLKNCMTLYQAIGGSMPVTTLAVK